MNDQAQYATDDSVIDGLSLLVAVWTRRWLVLVCAAVIVGLSVAYAYVAEPVYRGTAIVISASPGRNSMGGTLASALGSVGSLATLAGVNLQTGDPALEEAIAVLQSREFTQRFISERDLVPDLFPKRWDAAAKKWRVSSEDQPTVSNAFWVLDHARKILRDQKTGLITLRIDWTDRTAAANWANELIDALNAEMRARAIADADASVGYLQKELAATTDVGTRDAVNRLMEAQIKQRMLANVTKEYALRFVDRALVPDVDEPVRPRRFLLIFAGIFVGGSVGIGLAILLDLRRRVAQLMR